MVRYLWLALQLCSYIRQWLRLSMGEKGEVGECARGAHAGSMYTFGIYSVLRSFPLLYASCKDFRDAIVPECKMQTIWIICSYNYTKWLLHLEWNTSASSSSRHNRPATSYYIVESPSKEDMQQRDWWVPPNSFLLRCLCSVRLTFQWSQEVRNRRRGLCLLTRAKSND